MKTRLLLIDDDIDLLHGLKILLERHGYEVITACNGKSAFDLATKNEFDVVITDILIGDTHGAEVINHMKARYPHVKIITMSGGGHASSGFHIDSVRLFSPDSALAKPFRIEELISEIKRVMRGG